jgi:hypothetical protein
VGVPWCDDAWCRPYKQRQEHVAPLSRVHQDSGTAE